MSQGRTGRRVLTPKQEKFALSIVEGEAQSVAYRRSYDAGGMSDEAVAVEAARLIRHPAVKARVESLRRNLQRVLGVSRGSLLQELSDAQEMARQQGDTKTLAGIVMSKARLLGFLQSVPQPKSLGQREAEISFGAFDRDAEAE
jgi:hypothetical protein